ncbi:MAG: two-component system LytT family response regulator [Paraglaciecola sp.]|jgi:two-component system LytT family response regulator
MRRLTVIIVDDESLAREGLCLRLQQYPNISVLAACESATDALITIGDMQPDIVFLDIEMPVLSGLELAQQLFLKSQSGGFEVPKIVFVTAFQEFALNAFDFEALDYLLKPFPEKRLQLCLDKLHRAFSQGEVVRRHQELDKLLNRKTGNSIDGFIHNLEVSAAAPLDELQQTISLKSGSEWVRVRLDSILWIEAAGDYMFVHTQEGNHIIRKTLKQFEDELDMRYFPRVSRSAIVNLGKLSKLTPNSNGEYIAHLNSGEHIKVSRKYKFKLDELLQLRP